MASQMAKNRSSSDMTMADAHLCDGYQRMSYSFRRSSKRCTGGQAVPGLISQVGGNLNSTKYFKIHFFKDCS